jgi:hypothetical protein
MTPNAHFLAAATIAKAAGERPALEAGDLGPVCLRVTGHAAGEAVDFTVTADTVTVGAASMATATCKVGTFDLAARLLRRMGCVGPAAEAILVEELAALLGGEEGDSAGLEATAKRLQAAFAAKLPKVPRAGAVTVKAAALVVADDAAMAAK